MPDVPGQFKLKHESKPNPQAVVRSSAWRFILFTSRLIRIEYDPHQHFEDRASQIFWNRSLDRADGPISLKTGLISRSGWSVVDDTYSLVFNAHSWLEPRLNASEALDLPVLFDPADPHFTRAYFEILHHPQEARGMDFWWLDWQQGILTNLPGLDPIWWLNHLYALHLARDGRLPDHYTLEGGQVPAFRVFDLPLPQFQVPWRFQAQYLDQLQIIIKGESVAPGG
jgi:hypothetical protein